MVTEYRVAELASIARLGISVLSRPYSGTTRAISREAAQRFREFAARGLQHSAGSAQTARSSIETTGRLRQWMALVVALQIRGVSEPTRRTLSIEARARGESLQEYLLDLLDREARDIDSRRLLVEWTAGPSTDGSQPSSLVELIRSERDPQGSSLSSKLA
jgi:antitoxin FitA